jgi:hypothetical protein
VTGRFGLCSLHRRLYSTVELLLSRIVLLLLQLLTFAESLGLLQRFGQLALLCSVALYLDLQGFLTNGGTSRKKRSSEGISVVQGARTYASLFETFFLFLLCARPSLLASFLFMSEAHFISLGLESLGVV